MESSLNDDEEPMDQMEAPPEAEDDPPPKPRSTPKPRNRMPAYPNLPVQLTWKGVEIYINSRVVLTSDLKEKADEAMRLKILRESASTSYAVNERREDSASELNETVPPEQAAAPKTAWKIRGSAKPLSEQRPICKICSREFPSSRLLKRHLKTHSVGKGKTKRNHGPCPKCGTRFMSASGLTKHVQSCNVENSSTYDPPVVVKTEAADEDPGHDDNHFEDDHAETSEDGMDNKSVPGSAVSSSWSDMPNLEPSTTSQDVQGEPMKCRECSSTFTMSKEYRVHISRCAMMSQPLTEDGRVREHHCLKCPWKFTSSSHLKRHVKTAHTTAGIFDCVKCQATFHNQVNFDKHSKRCKIDVVEGVIEEVVPKQEIIDTEENNEDVGLPTTTEDQVTRPPFFCEICHRTFSSAHHLRQHSRTHTSTLVISSVSGGPGSPVPAPTDVNEPGTSDAADRSCKLCSRTFANSNNLKRHINNKSCLRPGPFSRVSQFRNREDQMSKLQCGKCDKTFASMPLLTQHSLSNCQDTGNDDVSQIKSLFKCDACGKGFDDKMELSRHCLSHVMGGISDEVNQSTSKSAPVPPTPVVPVGLVYSCKYKQCTHGFSHDEDLWYHIEKKHKAFDYLCCNFCGQDCDSESSLKSHKETLHPGVETQQNSNDEPVCLSPQKTFKVEAPEVHFNDDFQEDDYHPVQSDYEDDDNDNLASTAAEMERLKAEILQKNRTPSVLISAEIKSAAETALNALEAKEYAESESDSESDNKNEPEQKSESEGESDKEKQQETSHADIPEQDSYTCPDCSKLFDNRQRYIAHLNYHAFVKKRGIEWSGRRKPQPKQVESRERGVDAGKAKVVPPHQEVYICERCPGKKEYTDRQAFVSHITYHETMRKKGREWAIGTKKGWKGGRPRGRGTSSGQSEIIPENIPHMDVYTCNLAACNNKEYPDRKAYIMHLRYHEIMRKKGREWVIGTTRKGAIPREDIPVMEVYTCQFPACNNRTFPDRKTYIGHVNYHEKMREIGREWAIGLRRGRKVIHDSIPEQDSYTCEQCDNTDGPVVFFNRDEFLAHLDSHDNARRQRMLSSRKRRKMTAVHSDVPFQDVYTCDICDDRTYTNRGSYISHMAYHRSLVKQGFPNRKIGEFGALRRTDIPMDLEEYSCKYCPNVYTDRSKYIAHLYYHEVLYPNSQKEKEMRQQQSKPIAGADIPIKNVYRCNLCTTEIRTFSDREKYIQHLNYHKKKKRKLERALEDDFVLPDITSIPIQDTYLCKLCGEDKVFTQRYTYVKHLKYHQTMKNKTFQCSVCEKAFSSQWNLASHAKVHTNEKNFICGDCGKRYRQKHGLRKHQTMCKKVPCKYTCHCGDKFHSIRYLEMHVKKYHNKDKPKPVEPIKKFRCYVCDQEFIQAFELNQHVKDLHPQDYMEFMQQKAASGAVVNFEDSGNEGMDIDEEADVTQFIPEIVMKSEGPEINMDTEDATVTELSPSDLTEPEKDAEPSSSAAPTGETPSWNFISFLEDMDDDQNEEETEYYQEFSADAFEPEDVELQPNPLLENANVDTTLQKQQPLSLNTVVQSANFRCGYCDKTCHKEKFLKQHWGFKHKGLPFKAIKLVSATNGSSGGQTLTTQQAAAFNKIMSTQKQNPSSQADKVAEVARYKCAHCDKKSHQPRYIKVHHDIVHKGLQFDYVDLLGKTNETMLGKLLMEPPPVLVASNNNSSTSEQSSGQQIQPRRPSNDETESAGDNERTGGRVGPKSKLKCNCCVSDTALGYLKRCVGNSCPCYSNTKGCADGCTCNRICNNPYFRGGNKAQGQGRSLPDLVPVSVVPSVEGAPAGNSMSNPQPPQYALRIEPLQTPTPTMSELDQMYWNTITPGQNLPNSTAGNTPVTSTNSMPKLVPMVPSFEDTTIRVIPTLQPILPNPRAHVFKCNHCTQEFTNLSAYVTHQWSHSSPNQQKTFLCPMPNCLKEFSVLSHLVLHSRIHFQVFNCSACSASFEEEETRNQHFKSYHSSQDCQVCKLSFPSKVAWMEHQKKDHNLCHVCETPFSKDFYLKRHLYHIHGIRFDVPQNATDTAPPVPTSNNVSGGVQLIDLEEEEFRSASPPMPIIVGSSSMAVPPQPIQIQPPAIDFTQIIENFQVD